MILNKKNLLSKSIWKTIRKYFEPWGIIMFIREWF